MNIFILDLDNHTKAKYRVTYENDLCYDCKDRANVSKIFYKSETYSYDKFKEMYDKNLKGAAVIFSEEKNPDFSFVEGFETRKKRENE